MKILVIDGQGGKIGKLLVEKIKEKFPQHQLIAIGTNSIATAAMLRAGAEAGATGENPVIVNSADADIIVGPMGIIIANTLLGEITPAMALAVSSSKAHKVLIPMNKCNNVIVGTQELSLSEYVQMAVDHIGKILS